MGGPLRRCLLLPRCRGARGRRDHRPPGAHRRQRRAGGARRGRPERRGAGRRLPGRAAARLGGQHLVRHPGRPGRRGRRHRRTRPRSTWPARSPTRSPPTTPASTWSPPRRWSRWRSTARAAGGRLADGVRPRLASRSPASSAPAAARRRPCCRAGWSRSPTTPTPQMHVQFYDAVDGSLVCEAAVFGKGESASDNSLVAVGDASVVVENNYGYTAPWTHDGRPRDAGRPGPGGRRPGHRRVLGRLAVRRGRPDLGGQGLAGHRAGLRLHDPRVLVGRERVVPHRHRRPHRRDRVLGPHRHRHAVQQPLLRGHARPGRLGVRRDAGRDGAGPRPC